MMKTRFKYPIAVAYFIVLAVYWPLVALVPEGDFETAILDATAASVAAGVLVSFWPAIRDAMFTTSDNITRAHYLMLGVASICLSALVRFSWMWVYRVTGHPDWMMHHDALGWGLWIFIAGCSFHLAADQAGPNGQPPQKWIILGTMLAIASTAIGATLTLMLRSV
jgi:hypothetical protein